MNHQFPELRMARFLADFQDQSLQSMHATNPQPFSEDELQNLLNDSFADLLKGIDLGFNADEGAEKLRAALTQNLYERLSVENVITHAGGQEALFCAFNAILKAGEKVLAVAPIYEALYSIPFDIGCSVELIHLEQSNGWHLDLSAVEAHFQQGCHVFVINFPHNPTGAQIDSQDLKKIIQLCKKYDVWLLSDEVFRGLEHQVSHRLPAVADLYQKGISIGVISKAFAVPGLRVGWLASRNQQLIKKVLSIKGYLSICNSQIDEVLTTAVIKNHEKVLERNLKIILKNKMLLKKNESFCNLGIEITIPNAGCCCFALIANGSRTGQTEFEYSNELVLRLSEQHGYLVYPSSVFYSNVEGVRLGFGHTAFRNFLNQARS